MASNCFSASARSEREAASAETPRDALIAVARQAARIQIAVVTAAGEVFAGWANASDRFAQAVGDALLRRVDGETDSRELIVRVASATNVHLRELTALSSVAADHLNTRATDT